MEIRRTPNTRVSADQRGYQRAAPLDFTPLIEGVEAVAAVIDKRKKDAEEFELQRRLLRETNDMRAEYERMRLDPNVDFRQFSDTVATQFEQRSVAAVEEYRGYDRELLQEFELRLGNTRAQFYADALGHEVLGYRTQAGVDADDFIAEGARTLEQDWTAFETVADHIDTGLETLSNMLPEERMQYQQQARQTLRRVAARSRALSDPQGFLAAADPNGRYAPQEAPAVTGSAASVVAPSGSNENLIAITVHSESRGNPNAVSPAGARGLMQVMPATARNPGYGIQPSNGTQADDVRVGEEYLLAMKSLYNNDLGKMWAAYNAGPGRVDQAVSRYGADWLDHMPAETRNYVTQNLQLLAEREPVQTVDVPPSTAEQTPASSFAAPTTAEEIEITDPLILALEGDERMELIGLAQGQLNKSQVDQRSAMEVLINNVKAEALANGQVASPIPSDAEIIQTYGPVNGPQIVADMQQTIQVGRTIPTFATLSPEAIQSRIDALAPTPGSPTFASESQMHQAAIDAQSRILTERQADPAAYVLRHYPNVARAAGESTEAYYTAMRGALTQLGIDPATVPLMPEAAIRQQVQQYEVMPFSQRVEWIAEQYRTLGADGFQSFIGNFNGTSAQRDMRMFEVMRFAGDSPAASRDLIRQAIEGQEIAQRDPSRKPIPTVLQRYSTRMANAMVRLNSDVSTAIQNVAAGLYVSRGGDPRMVDADLYDQALADALGGNLPVNLRRGTAQFDTIIPPGFTPSGFDAWTDRLTAATLNRISIGAQTPVRGDLRTGITASEIADFGVFVMVTPGIYEIRMGDTPDAGTVMNTDGRPYRLRMTRGQ